MAFTRYELLFRHGPGTVVARGREPARTASDLVRDARAMAQALPPGAPGSEVLVICGDRYHFAASLLAAWSLGHAVALPPSGQPDLVLRLASLPHVVALLHDTDVDGGLDVRKLLGTAAATFAPLAIPAERLVATVYTSGSTADARPCRKTAAQLLGEADALVGRFGVGPGDTVLGTVPAHHLYGLLFTVLVPLQAGAAFVRETPLHPEAVAHAAVLHRATILASAPAHLRALAATPEAELHVRRIFSSGAPLDRATAAALDARAPSVVDVLGSSETGGIAHREPATEELWQPMPGVRVAADEDGMMLLTSPLLEPGAVQPLTCADRVEVSDDGRFRHLGRADGVVKVAGKRLSSADMEQRLRSLPGVQDAAVGARPVAGPRGEEVLAAVVAPGLSAAEVRRHLVAWFDPVVLPRRIRFVDALARDANGKLSRAAFLALFEKPATAKRSVDVLGRRSGADERGDAREVEVHVPADLVFFHGHFQGFPILPGVVELQRIVIPESRLAWPDLPGLRQLLRLKFRQPVRPGDRLVVRLERAAGADSVSFRIDRGEALCCSGTLVFGEA